ncbi:MAG: hypothetical protein ACJAZO_002017 [Myxococcota bacterium]|jgi:hypothetical protein
MLPLFLSLDLAKPTPTDTPRSAPTLYGAPIFAGGEARPRRQPRHGEPTRVGRGTRQYLLELEGQARYRRWMASADINISRTRQRRPWQSDITPDAQRPLWGDWQPNITVGASYLF